jgi:hypothetical protein
MMYDVTLYGGHHTQVESNILVPLLNFSPFFNQSHSEYKDCDPMVSTNSTTDNQITAYNSTTDKQITAYNSNTDR